MNAGLLLSGTSGRQPVLKRELTKKMTKAWLMTFLCFVTIQGHSAMATSRMSGPSRAKRSANTTSSSLADVTMIQDSPQELPVPPQVVQPKERGLIYRKTGGSVLLNCVATGFPKPTYQWTRNGASVPTDTQYFFLYSNGSLHIPNLSDREQGYFQCNATSQYGTSLSEVVDVRTIVEGNFVVPETKILQGTLGRGIQIPCYYKPFFDPPGSIDWYTQHKDQPDNSGNQVQIKKDARIYVDVNGTLYITRLEQTDEKADRFYVCAVNSVDQSTIKLGSKMALLKVAPLPQGDSLYSEPTLLNTTTYLEVDRGQEAILECIVAANPDASLTWFDKDGNRIVNSSRMIVTDFGRRLRIFKVAERDEGNFRCHANNSLGDIDGSVVLNVTSPPVFTYEQPNVRAPRGGEATFKCQARPAEGEWPLSPPRWFINGKPIETAVDPSQYSFTSHDKTEVTFRVLTDANMWCVQCNVTNQRGYAFWDRYLKVIEPLKITFQPNRTVPIKEGKRVELTVVASSDRCCPHKFAWQLNGKELSESAMKEPPFRYSTYGDSATLTIDANTTVEVQKALGTYRVVVFNLVYRSNETVDVIVHLEGVPPPDPQVGSTASLWWLGIVFGILFLIVVGIIVFLMIRYNFPRQAYFLEKEELKHKLDPKKDILDQSFTEM